MSPAVERLVEQSVSFPLNKYFFSSFLDCELTGRSGGYFESHCHFYHPNTNTRSRVGTFLFGFFIDNDCKKNNFSSQEAK